MPRVDPNFASSLAVYSLKLCPHDMNVEEVLLDASILLETFVIPGKKYLKRKGWRDVALGIKPTDWLTLHGNPHSKIPLLRLRLTCIKPLT